MFRKRRRLARDQLAIFSRLTYSDRVNDLRASPCETRGSLKGKYGFFQCKWLYFCDRYGLLSSSGIRMRKGVVH